MKIKAILVDDEKAPRELLMRLLKEHSDIELIRVCQDTIEANSAIMELNPDLIFLDVEMPGQTGIEWLQSQEKIPFEVIFTTSFGKYAVDAFRFAALDFLLKPIDELQLSQSLDRLRQRRQNNQQPNLIQLLENLKQSDTSEQKIALPTTNGFLFVRVAEIKFCSTVRNFVVVHLKDNQQIIISRSLKECEELLITRGFLRIHQSHLINLKYLKRYIRGDGGEVELEDGTVLEVSRRLKEGLMEAVKKI